MYIYGSRIALTAVAHRHSCLPISLYDPDLENIVRSMGSSDAYMRHQPKTQLVEIMVCRLFGAKL